MKKTRKQIVEEVATEMSKVKPFVLSAMKAVERYDENPCIATGRERQLTRDELYTFMMLNSQTIWRMWQGEYSDYVSDEEMRAILDEAASSVEFDTDEQRDCWKGLYGGGNRT